MHAPPGEESPYLKIQLLGLDIEFEQVRVKLPLQNLHTRPTKAYPFLHREQTR